MNRLSTLLFWAGTLVFGLSAGVTAQTRYVDPIFEVDTVKTVTYGANIDVFLAQIDPALALNQLSLEIYEPLEDTAALRPVVVFFPTGNFLPQYFNRGPFGTLRDSALVEMATRLTARGYVSMSAEYRTGWLPNATDQETRTSTLLQAVYRGGQDAHNVARYLRKSVAEDGNPYRIDTSRIVFWGLGTGGYVVMTHAFLDRVDEILADARFFGSDGVPYVVEEFFSNPQGTTATNFPASAGGAPSNIPNFPTYESSVAMSINANGALGDIDWMEGKESEPLVLGFHSPTDTFAPFSIGTVIVPTTNEVVVDDVAGTEAILEKANRLGLNAEIEAANDLDLPDIFSDLSEAVNAQNEEYKQVTILPGNVPYRNELNDTFQLSHDNMYAFSYPGIPTASPYNWIDSALVRQEIIGFNATFMQMLDPDDLIEQNETQDLNPNLYDGAGARTVIDTMIAFFIPRAYIGLELDSLSTSTENLITNEEVNFNLYPNPATGSFTLETSVGTPIREITIFDLNGRSVSQFTSVNSNRVTLNRGNLPNGQYVVRLRFDQGVTARKLFLN